jgi:hypothetical protein
MPKSTSTGSVRVHLTASEAYPALEAIFLAAKTEVWASFLVFDLETKLRSDAGLAIGQTWFDLLVHVLRRGVAVHFVLADVDPIARPKMHRVATRSLRRFCAARECAGPVARLEVAAQRHPAQTGAGLRMLIWPYIIKRLRSTVAHLNTLPDDQRDAALRDMPGLAPYITTAEGGQISARLMCLPRIYPTLHHQKLAVIDRKTLYIGGLDLDERRFDTPEHDRAGPQTWHDLQLILDGPVVVEAQAHLERFRAAVAGEGPVATYRRLLTTVSRKRENDLFRFGPTTGAMQFRTAHAALTARVTQLVYLESQYFRDRTIAMDLARRAKAQPGLTMILILPAAPEDVAFQGKRGLDARYGEFAQARALRIIRRAFGDRLFVGSPAQRRRAAPRDNGEGDGDRDRLDGAPIIYVHAKVSVFDDASAIVSSANLNARSLSWDTEAGVYLYRRNEVEDLRRRIMAHWLPDSVGPEAFAMDSAAAVWGRVARANARAQPKDRAGFLLPHDFAAAETFGKALPMIPEELV